MVEVWRGQGCEVVEVWHGRVCEVAMAWHGRCVEQLITVDTVWQRLCEKKLVASKRNKRLTRSRDASEHLTSPSPTVASQW